MNTNISDLIKRLHKALETHTLRALGCICGISHESVRQFILKSKTGDVSMTVATFNKIDAGLKKLGFSATREAGRISPEVSSNESQS